MASNSGTAPAAPNPNTPLAFLPPALADQYQATSYVVVATLSAFMWDWFLSMPGEYKIFHRTRFNTMPDISYALSRIGTLGFCVGSTVFQVSHLRNCQALLYISGGFFILSMSTTPLLFFYRVRAVFANSRAITAFFGFLWLATSGLSILIPLSIFGAHIEPTNRCILTATRSYVSVPVVVNAINDTLIFLAISYHIISCTLVGDTWSARAKSFFSADGLPKLSKSLLQSGQLYYFATIGVSIALATLLLSPSVPSVYQGILSVPNIALENAMACRVYRAVKLGVIKHPQSTVFQLSARSHTTGEWNREPAFGSVTQCAGQHGYHEDDGCRDYLTGKPALSART